jgi:PhnB protein
MFKGDCEAAFHFYAECLGGKIEGLHTFDGSPMADKMPAEWRKKVMHARMSIGDKILMGSDPPPDRYQPPQGFSVCVEASAPAEAEHIFAALAKGGQVHMPIQKTFWAARYGMLTDQFGIPWMVNCEKGD